MNGEEFAMVSQWMDYGNIMHYVRDYPQTNALKLARNTPRLVFNFIDSGLS